MTSFPADRRTCKESKRKKNEERRKQLFDSFHAFLTEGRKEIFHFIKQDFPILSRFLLSSAIIIKFEKIMEKTQSTYKWALFLYHLSFLVIQANNLYMKKRFHKNSLIQPDKIVVSTSHFYLNCWKEKESGGERKGENNGKTVRQF